MKIDSKQIAEWREVVEAGNAGTVEMTISELRKLGRESSDYWEVSDE